MINSDVKIQSNLFCNFSLHSYVKLHMNVTFLYTIQSIHFCIFMYLVVIQYFRLLNSLEFYAEKSRYVANLYTILLVENLYENLCEKCGQNSSPLFAKQFKEISTFIFYHNLPLSSTLFHNLPPKYIFKFGNQLVKLQNKIYFFTRKTIKSGHG